MNPALLALLAARAAAPVLATAYRWAAFANNGAATSTSTFSGIQIGTASPDRTVVVFIYTRKSGPAAATLSVTIGGVAAIVDHQVNRSWSVACVAHATVPSGTTADVVVTASGAQLQYGQGIAVWTIDGAVAAHTSGSSVLGSTVQSVALAASAGVLIAAVGVESWSAATSWTESINEECDTGGSKIFISGGSSHTEGGAVVLSATTTPYGTDPIEIAVNYIAA